MGKIPAFQMYPGDWMKDPALRSCSLAARGLWMDMLCLMFECDRRGYLQSLNGTPYSHEHIARMTGCSSDEVSRLIAELETSGVFSRTKDGVIFSRRQVRDEESRADNRARQNRHRNIKKTNENSNADITHDITPLSHASSISSSKQKTVAALPPWLKPDVWEAWLEMRLKIPRAPFTDKARNGILADLTRLHEWGIDPNERLEKGIRSSWRGVLFDSDKPTSTPKSNPLAGMTFANRRPQ